MTISSPDNNRYRVHHHPKHVNTPLGHTLSLIEHPSSLVRFLILDCPTESTLSMYLEEFRNLHVSVVVRCCQPTYSTDSLFQRGIQVVDLPFKDGGIPPSPIIHEWLHVVEQAKNKAKLLNGDPMTIAVHCVAGLGRAPVLVAIALIELGMAPLDAIEYIRDKRRGAFNKPQITFLDGYRRKPTTHTYSFRTSLGKMLGFGPKHPSTTDAAAVSTTTTATIVSQKT
ncbi:unnamed protein product [Mucor hiemalis]